MTTASNRINIIIPNGLGDRLTAICKQFRISKAYLVREGVELKLREYEDRERIEFENKENKKKALISSLTGARGIDRLADERGILQRPDEQRGQLTPLTTLARLGAAPSTLDLPANVNPIDALYDKLSQSILEAGDDINEMKKRADFAIHEVKRNNPLTHPPEEAILRKLEQHMNSLRESGQFVATVTRKIDESVGSLLDVSKIRTAGPKASE